MIAATFLHQEPRDTPGCIQACLGFSTVNVVDPHSGVSACCNRWFDHQQLVSTDANMAIADPTDFRARGLKRLTAASDNDEVVGKAMHLQERASTKG